MALRMARPAVSPPVAGLFRELGRRRVSFGGASLGRGCGPPRRRARPASPGGCSTPLVAGGEDGAVGDAGRRGRRRATPRRRGRRSAAGELGGRRAPRRLGDGLGGRGRDRRRGRSRRRDARAGGARRDVGGGADAGRGPAPGRRRGRRGAPTRRASGSPCGGVAVCCCGIGRPCLSYSTIGPLGPSCREPPVLICFCTSSSLVCACSASFLALSRNPMPRHVARRGRRGAPGEAPFSGNACALRRMSAHGSPRREPRLERRAA